jgi:hypothetical protein
MKTKKILLYLLLALPAVLFQSCVSDQEDIFDKPSSERVSDFIAAVQDTLSNATYGWELDYYPESHQVYGGFVYGLKFDRDQVTASFETNPDVTKSSLYSMKKDMGPVISFDSHNPFLHFFSTPAEGLYEGYEGDFEFVVDSLGSDVIKVHGKRSQNTMYLRKLKEDPKAYVNKVVSMGDSFNLYASVGTIGGLEANVFFDVENHQLVISSADAEYASAYAYTDKGLRLFKPLTIGGVTVSELTYDDSKLTLKAEGVDLSIGVQNPNSITSVIGSVGSDDESLSRTYKGLPHLDQFVISSDKDWCTVSVDGDKLIVNATENTTGDVRSATITVSNKLVPSISSEFVVTQCKLEDVLGNYNMYYYNSDGKLTTIPASLKNVGGKLSLNATVTINLRDENDQPVPTDYVLKFPVTFNQASGSLTLQSGQNIGEINGYPVFDVFLFGNQSQWSSYSDEFTVTMPFGYLDGFGTYAQLGDNVYYKGQAVGTLDGIMLEACSTETPTSTSDLLAMFDLMSGIAIVKNDNVTAKMNDASVKKLMKVSVPLTEKVKSFKK